MEIRVECTEHRKTGLGDWGWSFRLVCCLSPGADGLLSHDLRGRSRCRWNDALRHSEVSSTPRPLDAEIARIQAMGAEIVLIERSTTWLS
jgi:hypothetical protein